MMKSLLFSLQQGFVEVLPWNLPVPYSELHDGAQVAAYNDCLYRSMTQFR